MVSTIKRSSLVFFCVLLVLTSFIFSASAVGSTYTFNCPQPVDAGFDGFVVVPIYGNSSYVPSVLVAWSITPLILTDHTNADGSETSIKNSVLSIGTFASDSFDINFSSNNPDNSFMITWFYMFNGDTNVSSFTTESFSYSEPYSIHFNIDDIINLSNYPSAKFIHSSFVSGLSQVNSFAPDVGFTYNCLFNADITVFNELVKITDHFASLLSKTDYTNSQLDTIVSEFSTLLESVSNIDSVLGDFVYFYWSEFVDYKLPEYLQAVINKIEQIRKLLDKEGKVEQTTVDTSKLDEFADVEGSLVHNDEAESAIGDMEVSIDGQAYSFIWDLITRILNTHPEVFGLFISVLTLGFLALILNR